MVSELWGCCRDQLAFGYFGVPLPKIRIYLQDGWRLLSEPTVLHQQNDFGYWTLILYNKKQPELTGNHNINYCINFQIFSQWFHVLLLYQFQDLQRYHPFARNVFESEGAGEVTIESCPAFSGLSDDISENPGQVHCCWQIPVFNGPHPPHILKMTYISLFRFINFYCLQ